MTTHNKTSEIKYCEKCGTMTVSDTCPRCDPTKHNDNKIVYKSNRRLVNGASDNQIRHNEGVEYVMSKLAEKGIAVKYYNARGTDMILDSGKTILVRAQSEERMLTLANKSLDYLNADYVIMVSKLDYNIRNVYIISADVAKSVAVDLPRSNSGESEYVVMYSEYAKYRDNYDVLKGV